MATIGGRPTFDVMRDPVAKPPAQGLYSYVPPATPQLGGNRPGLSQPAVNLTQYYLDGRRISPAAYDFEKYGKPAIALSQQADVSKLDVNTYRNPEALRLFLQSQEAESASAASYLRRQALLNAIL